MGNKTHKQHIEKMFEIIEFVFENSDGSLPCETKELEKMFRIFVTQRISNFESETLFELICSSEKSSRGISRDNYLLDPKTRKFIFQNCLGRKGYVNPQDYSPKSFR